MRIHHWILGGLLVVLADEVRAFPEMVTHGYVNCTACHVSPTGGSALNSYGRGLSKELLSRWGSDDEEKFLHGKVETPEWLITGGDLRVIQTYMNNSEETQREFFLMQSDLVLGARMGDWTGVLTFGAVGGPEDVPDHGRFLSRSHYVMNQVTEMTEVRAGKFLPQYGINDPNHTLFTRGNLGFGEDSESYNLEVAYLGEKFDIFVTGVFGRPDQPDLQREKGAALSASFNFWDRNKVGVSAYRGQNDSNERILAGLWGIFALPSDVFLLSELDSTQVRLTGVDGETRGFVTSQRLGWEATKGLQLYLSGQIAQSDLESDQSRIDSFGPGIAFYPRPHFEFRAEMTKVRIKAVSNEYGEMGFLFGHYYF